MCDLCSSYPDERKRAQKTLLAEAENLRRLANKLELIATGHIKPHSHEVGPVTSIARKAIRYLVEEWM
jgi:hypothetical protein